MTTFNRFVFKTVYNLDLLYIRFMHIIHLYCYLPYLNSFKRIYNSDIIRIDEIDFVSLKKRSIFYLSTPRVLSNLVISYFYDIKHIHRKHVRSILETLRMNTNDHVYLVTYANGKQMLTRNPKLQYPLTCGRKDRKYLMVLVNNEIDITAIYKNTLGSINKELGLLPRELAAIALLDTMDTYSLLNIFVNPSTYITAIDDETFEETVFKGTDIVNL